MGSPSHPTGARPGDAGALVERALQESLRSIAHPATTEPLVQQALSDCGELDVPPGGERLESFVRALAGAVRSALGDAEADALALDLRRILALAPDDDEVSQVRPVSDAPDHPDAALPRTDPPFDEVPGPAPRPILLASRTPGRAERLDEQLPPTRSVRTVADALALLDAAGGAERAPVLVLDCDHPSVQPSTLGALVPELPEGTQIVTWGASARDIEDLRRVWPPSHEWIASEPGASEADIAAVIERLES